MEYTVASPRLAMEPDAFCCNRCRRSTLGGALFANLAAPVACQPLCRGLLPRRAAYLFPKTKRRETKSALPALPLCEISVRPGFSTLGDPPRSPCAPAGASKSALNRQGCASPLFEGRATPMEVLCPVQFAIQAARETLSRPSPMFRISNTNLNRPSLAEWGSPRSVLNSSRNRSKPPELRCFSQPRFNPACKTFPVSPAAW